MHQNHRSTPHNQSRGVLLQIRGCLSLGQEPWRIASRLTTKSVTLSTRYRYTFIQ